MVEGAGCRTGGGVGGLCSATVEELFLEADGSCFCGPSPGSDVDRGNWSLLKIQSLD